MDCFGNPIGPAGSGGAGANVPPTNMPTMGSLRDPATGLVSSTSGGNRGAYNPASGDEEQNDGTSSLSLAARIKAFLGLGVFAAGSKERQAFSDHIQQFSGPFGTAYSGYIAAGGWDPIAGRCLSIKERLSIGLGVAVLAAVHVHGQVEGLPRRIDPLLPRQETPHITKIRNILANLANLEKDHIGAAVGDHLGRPITNPDTGKIYNHTQDLLQDLTGLRNAARKLARAGTPEGIEMREEALRKIAEIEEQIRGVGI